MKKLLFCLPRKIILIMLFIFTSSFANSAPSVSTVTGTVSHGESITVSGSGFDTKSTAAPLVWDNASGSDPYTLWDGYWPDETANATYRLDYRTPETVGRGVAVPHSHVTQYLCGAHYASDGSNKGYNVAGWQTLSGWSWPVTYYMSWYYRVDPNWDFPDDNHKWFGYSSGGDIYGLPYNWYLESVGGMESSFGSHLVDDDSEVGWTTGEWYGNSFPNHPINQWVKIEVETKISDSTDGYIKVWADGTLVQNLTGDTTDGTNYGSEGSNRSIGFGGYNRTRSTNQWRYFADIYFDNTPQRVVICNNSTYSSCTVREIQIPTAWSDTSITATVNAGVFASDATAYLFVVDADGVASAGKEITFGEGAGSTIIKKIMTFFRRLRG